ncbi:MAG: PVC-type heme-binding CxxCH protein [Planctomycetota bacterium]
MITLARYSLFLPAVLTCAIFCCSNSFAKNNAAAKLVLNKGDSICLIGNTLGERMQHNGHWEAILQTRFPEMELTVRNLCFPADEIDVRPRSLNFGSPDDHLKHSKADVVMAFFGFNESFQGMEGISDYKTKLTQFVKDTQGKNYSGKANAKVVLVAPIPVEHSKDPAVDADARNTVLVAYSKATQEVAEATGAVFADVYDGTSAAYDAAENSMTINGFHLSDDGYAEFAKVLDSALFGSAGESATASEKLLSEINDKNFHWWHRYRAVNGFSIYGKRGQAGFDGTYNNQQVMERERAILDQMCAIRDKRIWDIAQGKEVSAEPDDSGTLPFYEVKTNLEAEIKKGKLGTLEYLPAEEQLKAFELAEGYVIELVASEEQFPELANPVALNFDGRGRLWVSTMSSYPHWQPKTKMDDKLLIFEDHDGDGRADKCITFAGGLHQPTGFELGHGGAYVAVQPDILFLKDTDGDDQADVRVRKLVGFDTADSHHGLGAFEWSPGGTLHCMEGIFKYSNIESLNGPIRANEGAVWGYDPKLERFRAYTYFGFTNPWSHTFDRWGQDYITDGTSGQHYYVPPFTTDLDFPLRHRGRRDKTAKENPYPQVLKKIVRPSTGADIVSSSNFPDEAQGDYLIDNVIGTLGVLQYSLRPEGSGMAGDYKGTLVTCKYGNFRPVDCQFGPDGALYICDWQNALIGHLQHNLRDPNRDHSHGRIWRIRYEGKPLAKVVDLESASTDDVVKELGNPQMRVRYAARRELAARDADQVVQAIAGWVKTIAPDSEQGQHDLLEALWVQQSHRRIDKQLLETVLNSEDYRARAAAVRVVCDARFTIDGAFDYIKSKVSDENPRVRREAVRACSFFKTEESMESALEALNGDTDSYLEYTLEETLRQLEK